MNNQKDLDSRTSDYLWDGSGAPDVEIVRLEKVLHEFRHAGTPPNWAPDDLPAREERFSIFTGRPAWFAFAAVAASILMVVSVWIGMRPGESAPPAGVVWGVESVTGRPRVGSKAIGRPGEKGTLRLGQTLETDGQSRASITVSEVGKVEIDPQTRLRLVESQSSRTRLSLELGTIHARIWAPAGEFAVDTPSALAVDLGCIYTLHVNEAGEGVLRTTMGWVGFKFNDREAFIPAGAIGETRPGIGPGTPFFEDASAQFRTALSEFDFGKLSEDQRRQQLAIVLSTARKSDALTLWHLLSRAQGDDRLRVFDQLASFVPAPASVTREGILRGDPAMRDAWWNQLGFDDMAVWRTWERSWDAEVKR